MRSGMRKGYNPNTQITAGIAGTAVTAVTYTASGALNPADTVIDLNTGAAKIAMTLAAGFDVGHIYVITQVDSGTDGHTVTIKGTFDKTNNTATFNAQYEALVLLVTAPDRMLILKNYGSVGLSSV